MAGEQLPESGVVAGLGADNESIVGGSAFSGIGGFVAAHDGSIGCLWILGGAMWAYFTYISLIGQGKCLGFEPAPRGIVMLDVGDGGGGHDAGGAEKRDDVGVFVEDDNAKYDAEYDFE